MLIPPDATELCRRPTAPTISKVAASGSATAIAVTALPATITNSGKANLTYTVIAVPVAGGANLTQTASGLTPTQAHAAAVTAVAADAPPAAAVALS